MSMITATSWIPRGFPAQFPTRAEFDEHEFERIQELANLQLQDAKDDLEGAREAKSKRNGAAEHAKKIKNSANVSKTDPEIDDDLKEYDLEHYDDSPEEDIEHESEEGETGTDALGMFGNVKNLVYHNSNQDDPYITLKDDEAESDSEREELQVLPTDNMVLAARIEDEVAHLEFYVYEDDADNLYVHHDVMLPAIPLCVEWLNTPITSTTTGSSTAPRNFVAVGTMDPDIELWDLDTVDSMYPQLILGAGGLEPVQDPNAAIPTGKKKKRKHLRTSKISPTHHTAAVLALASNRNHANLLASASADSTIKLWDLSSATPAVAVSSYSHHTDKVCSLSWHPTETTVLLSGSYDRTIVAADMRASDSASARRIWSVESDVESVLWDPHDPNFFYAATESGILYYFDARTTSERGETKPVWRLQAHDEAISAFDANPHIPGFLATGSADKTVKLWNVATAAGEGAAVAGPSLVTTRNLPDTGRIFSAVFAPDAAVAFRLSVAGSKGNLQVWDTSTNRGVREAFASKMKAEVVMTEGDDVKDRITGVRDDESESEDDVGEDGWEDEGDEAREDEDEDEDDEEMVAED